MPGECVVFSDRAAALLACFGSGRRGCYFAAWIAHRKAKKTGEREKAEYGGAIKVKDKVAAGGRF